MNTARHNVRSTAFRLSSATQDRLKPVLRTALQTLAGTAIFLGSTAFGQVIRIHKEANVDGRQDVRLGDLAAISGADSRTAETLANLVVLPDVRESKSVRAEAILMAVIAQIGPGSLADHLQVAGSATCEVKLQTSTAGAAVQISAAAPVEQARQLFPEGPAPSMPSGAPSPQGLAPNAAATQSAAAPTLAKLLIAEIQQNLGAKPEDIRVSFNTSNLLLDQPTPAGKKWVFRPLTRSYLGTVQFEAQLVDGVRVVQKFNLQVEVLKHQQVLNAVAPLSRGDVVTREHFRVDEAWIDRQMPTLMQNEKDVIGLEALRPVAVGAMLDQRDFKPVEMATRGDAVSVIFMHGNLKVQMKGLAMESGKLHDSIQIRNDGTTDTYQATLIGKRLAVIGGLPDEAQEKQLRETR
jgi:flagella basal body P-ring formation protein FlgA